MGDRKRPADGDNGGEERYAKRQFSNEYVVKMLCPGRCAGAIIGTGGEKIKMLKEQTGANVKVTKNRENFPRTDERVVTISGSVEGLQECVARCQELIRNDKPPEGVTVKDDSKRKQQLKLLVAGTSAGRIIGRSGSKVNQLRKDHNVNVDVTKPENLIYGLDENPVTITGGDEDINNCGKEIIELIMEDKNASMKWNVDYTQFGHGGPVGGDRGGYGGRNDYSDGYGGGNRGGYDNYNRGGGGGYDNYGQSAYNSGYDNYSGSRDYKSGGGVGYDSQGYGGYGGSKGYGGGSGGSSYGERRDVAYPPARSSGGYGNGSRGY